MKKITYFFLSEKWKRKMLLYAMRATKKHPDSWVNLLNFLREINFHLKFRVEENKIITNLPMVSWEVTTEVVTEHIPASMGCWGCYLYHAPCGHFSPAYDKDVKKAHLDGEFLYLLNIFCSSERYSIGQALGVFDDNLSRKDTFQY